jgi:ribosomal protein S27E
MATQIQIERPRPREERLQPPTEDFGRIRCRDCGRSYPALDGPALLYSLKASCPVCGGGFELQL